MGPEAGDIIVHDFHLSPRVARVLKEVDLVVGAVLGGSTGEGLPFATPAHQDPPSLADPIAAATLLVPRGTDTPAQPLLTIWRGRMDIRLSLLRLLDQESQRG